MAKPVAVVPMLLLEILIFAVPTVVAQDRVSGSRVEEGWDEVYSRPGLVTRSDSLSRCGDGALRMEVRFENGPLDEVGLHSDVRLRDVGGPGMTKWISFSTYLPSSAYELDAFDEERVDRLDYAWIMQVFLRDPSTSPVISSPVLALVYNELGEWTIASYSGHAADAGEKPRVWHVGPRRDHRDDWIDWVIHVEWSTQEDGSITVWRNGKRFGPYRGPNWYASYGAERIPLPPDLRGRLILGIYANRWRGLGELPDDKTLRSKVVYVDEVNVSDRWGGREDMRPCS